MSVPSEALTLPQRFISYARVLSERSSLISLLPKQCIVAEIGVGLGIFTQEVLHVCQPKTFIAIDTFRLHEIPNLWGKTPEEHFEGLTHETYYRKRFDWAIGAGTLQIKRGDSIECLEQLDDKSIDVLYVDADHEYEAVRRDLAVAHRKVTDEGWLILNDYLMVGGLNQRVPYGVVQAANEFMVEHDWGMQYFVLHPQMFCDVALRKSAYLQNATDWRSALAAGHDTVETLRTAIDTIMASHSWRYTAPLRWVTSAIRSGAIRLRRS